MIEVATITPEAAAQILEKKTLTLPHSVSLKLIRNESRNPASLTSPLTDDERNALQSRSDFARKALEPISETACTNAIKSLLVNFPVDNRDDLDQAKMRIATFVALSLEFPKWAVDMAVHRFVAGMVMDQNPNFAPTPAAFARELRAIVAPYRSHLAELAMTLKAPVERRPLLTVEEAERRKEMVSRLLRDHPLNLGDGSASA